MTTNKELEYQAKRIYEKIHEYDYSEIEDEVLFAIIFTLKEARKELIKEFEKMKFKIYSEARERPFSFDRWFKQQLKELENKTK